MSCFRLSIHLLSYLQHEGVKKMSKVFRTGQGKEIFVSLIQTLEKRLNIMFQDFSRACQNQPAPELEKGVGGSVCTLPPATLGSPVITKQGGLSSARLSLWTWPQKAKQNEKKKNQTPQNPSSGVKFKRSGPRATVLQIPVRLQRERGKGNHCFARAQGRFQGSSASQ